MHWEHYYPSSAGMGEGMSTDATQINWQIHWLGTWKSIMIFYDAKI